MHQDGANAKVANAAASLRASEAEKGKKSEVREPRVGRLVETRKTGKRPY